jgi:hypothetical protein
MKLNVEKELAAMRGMSIGDLRSRYAEVFGETTNTRHKDWLIKRIIWRMQAIAEGDLTERARRRAEELASDADLRCRPPKASSATPDPVRTATRRPASNADLRIPLPALFDHQYGAASERPYTASQDLSALRLANSDV